ncbi:MAG: helix-turn-helix transcriptional regulator [Novosphingobium sp.]|nr:helix-turn-helix transcriptional regulator [Novosphingobium sp.]
MTVAFCCHSELQKATVESRKETETPRRHGKWYNDACGTAFALELIGERWSLLIVRELMFGGRRFSDLRAALPGISAKVLAERLDGLEQAGIVQRRRLPPPAASQIYELTPWGYDAEEAIQALGRWAAASADHDPTLPLSAASLMVSFRTMFDPKRAKALACTATIWVGEESFRLRVAKGHLSIRRGEAKAPDFTIAAPVAAPIAALVYVKVPAAELAAAGLSLDGDLAVAARFVDLFHLPARAA